MRPLTTWSCETCGIASHPGPHEDIERHLASAEHEERTHRFLWERAVEAVSRLKAFEHVYRREALGLPE